MPVEVRLALDRQPAAALGPDEAGAVQHETEFPRALGEARPVTLRAGERVEERRERGRRHGLGLDQEPARDAERHALFGLRGRLEGGRVRHHVRQGALRARRAHGDDQAVDRLRAPAQRARELRVDHVRAGPDVGQEGVAFRRRAMEEHLLAVRLARLERGQDLRLRFRAEAGNAPHAPGLEGVAESLDGGDPERLVERGDPRDAEPRDLAQLDHAGRQRGAEPIELLAPPRQMELADRPGQRRADTGELGQPAVGHERRQIRSQRLERPGAALVRAGLERILALELQQEADLAQGVGDRQAVHASRVPLASMVGIAKARRAGGAVGPLAFAEPNLKARWHRPA